MASLGAFGVRFRGRGSFEVFRGFSFVVRSFFGRVVVFGVLVGFRVFCRVGFVAFFGFRFRVVGDFRVLRFRVRFFGRFRVGGGVVAVVG